MRSSLSRIDVLMFRRTPMHGPDFLSEIEGCPRRQKERTIRRNRDEAEGRLFTTAGDR